MSRLSSMGRFLLLSGAAAMLAAACGGTNAGSPSLSPVDVGTGSLVGAGATFPAPFYTKACADYTSKYPHVTINSQAVGYRAGADPVPDSTVDFATSEGPWC